MKNARSDRILNQITGGFSLSCIPVSNSCFTLFFASLKSRRPLPTPRMSSGICFPPKRTAAIPLGLLFKPTKTYAATSSPVDVLNFALTLEYLESSFYTMGLNAGIVPSSDMAIISQISKHETAHVATLKSAITASGGTPVAEPQFDFTAGGTFSDVFTNYTTFLVLANAFEDTGVRAYKGQAFKLRHDGICEGRLYAGFRRYPTLLMKDLDRHLKRRSFSK